MVHLQLKQALRLYSCSTLLSCCDNIMLFHIMRSFGLSVNKLFSTSKYIATIGAPSLICRWQLRLKHSNPFTPLKIIRMSSDPNNYLHVNPNKANICEKSSCT
jgi:hypothetical protein